ncbi:MAG: hypothetical protein ACT4OX_05010 [Actinomycetota bacterium]
MLDGPARHLQVDDGRITFDAIGPGRFDVRVRASAHWHLAAGDACLVATSDGWVEVDVTRAGIVVLEPRVDLVEAVVGRAAPECAGSARPQG